MSTTILNSFDTIFIVGTTSSCITLSLTGICLIVIQISAGMAFGLTNNYEVLCELVMPKYNKHKIQYQKYLQSVKSFNKLNRKSSQDNLNDEKEYKALCKIFTECLLETKLNVSTNMKIKKNQIFSVKLN